jgi:hypothetical protein
MIFVPSASIVAIVPQRVGKEVVAESSISLTGGGGDSWLDRVSDSSSHVKDCS